MNRNSLSAIQNAHSRYQFQAFPFHLVESSPWPILTSNAVLSMMIGAVLYFNGIAYGRELLTLGFLATLFAFILWFRDVTTEGTYLGDHTLIVQKGLTMGVSLFIVTEVFFFVSIFWALD
jgi:cytochrome c oxidase subunit 3